MPQERGILPNVKMPPQNFCKIILNKINNKKSFFPHITRQVPTGYQREGSKKKKKKYMGRFGKWNTNNEILCSLHEMRCK